jgi:hypothetical protein
MSPYNCEFLTPSFNRQPKTWGKQQSDSQSTIPITQKKTKGIQLSTTKSKVQATGFSNKQKIIKIHFFVLFPISIET